MSHANAVIEKDYNELWATNMRKDATRNLSDELLAYAIEYRNKYVVLGELECHQQELITEAKKRGEERMDVARVALKMRGLWP